MRAGDLKRIVLKMFKGREFYGYEVHKKLASEDIKVEISRLYRILSEMLREGLLKSRWEKSQFGPEKRVYMLGEKGRKELDKILLDAIETVHDFYAEYLLSLSSKTSVFNSICRLLTRELKGQGNIAYITTEYSAMHEKMICSLRNKVPQRRIYLVKPRSVAADLRLDNLLFLDGAYDNVPLRDGYVDLLLVTDMPQKDFLDTALREWRRVLKKSGTLAILTPTVLVHKYKDPLTIGNFIERYEHETLGRGILDKEFFKALLKNFFQKVEERQIVHMTIFLASEPRSHG